jgi:uncharacterized protein
MKVRDRMHIVLNTKAKINNPTFVIGFQGVGLVGTMASQHLADKLKCKLIGHIESEYLPPIAILEKDSLTYPIRIYYSKKYNLIIVSSEVPVTSDFAYEMSHDIIELMKRFNSKMAYVLEGLVTREEKPNKEKVYGVPSNDKVKKFLQNNKIETIKTGAILGVAGSILLTTIENNIDSCALMAESHTNIPDAIAASAVLKKLGEILNFKVDISELEKKGEDIEKKIKKLITTMRTFKRKDKKPSEDSKVLYG